MLKFKSLLFVLTLITICSCNQQTKTETSSSTSNTDEFDRSVLPIKEPIYNAETELDARNAKAPKRFGNIN
jgi:arylsulfatase